MTATTTDRLWRRWREDQHAPSLGRLFDRCAPELLALARHLCRDTARAEDVVQATFLAAIENAASTTVGPTTWSTPPGRPPRWSSTTRVYAEAAKSVGSSGPITQISMPSAARSRRGGLAGIGSVNPSMPTTGVG